jgi:hypothetical protein
LRAESGVDFAGAALRGANRAAVYFAANKINPRNFCRNGIFDSAFNAVYFHIHGAYNANHKFNLAKKECVRPARRIIDKNLIIISPKGMHSINHILLYGVCPKGGNLVVPARTAHKI